MAPDYLRRATVRIESIGRDIEIRQLHAKAQAEALDAYNADGKNWLGGFVAVKYGVPEWTAMTVEELSTTMTLAQMREIVEKINELSDADSKNSDSTRSESSSSS